MTLDPEEPDVPPHVVRNFVQAERARVLAEVRQLIEVQREWHLSHMNVPFVVELDELLAEINAIEGATHE